MSSDALAQFQSQASNITSSLTSISREFDQVCGLLKERGFLQASEIVDTIQKLENDKLQLVFIYLISLFQLFSVFVVLWLIDY